MQKRFKNKNRQTFLTEHPMNAFTLPALSTSSESGMISVLSSYHPSSQYCPDPSSRKSHELEFQKNGMEKVVKEVPCKLNAVWTTHQHSRSILVPWTVHNLAGHHLSVLPPLEHLIPSPKCLFG